MQLYEFCQFVESVFFSQVQISKRERSSATARSTNRLRQNVAKSVFNKNRVLACVYTVIARSIFNQPQQFLPVPSTRTVGSTANQQPVRTSACPKIHAFTSGLSPARESHHNLEKPIGTKIKKPSLIKTPNLPSVHSRAQCTDNATHHLPAPFSRPMDKPGLSLYMLRNRQSRPAWIINDTSKNSTV